MIDNRPISKHATRVAVMQKLYSSLFDNISEPNKSFSSMRYDADEVEEIFAEIQQNLPRFNEILQKFVSYDVKAIKNLEYTILLMGVRELLTGKIEHKIVLQESINLAKEYCGSSTYKFINGVLSATARHLWDEGHRYADLVDRPK